MLRIVLSLGVVIFLTGCLNERPDLEPSVSERPNLYYVASPGSDDLTKYPEFADIIARHFLYRKIQTSAGYDELLAQSKYDRLKRMPNFRRSTDYWEYLRIRDAPNSLSADDVNLIRGWGLKQVPIIVVAYPDGERRFFDKQMSGEMFSELIKNGDFRSGGRGEEALEAFWNIQRAEDRPELVHWLESAVLR
ncbi:hypothetical protein RM543_17605 [Roseicyclus sp. F158]|uniref:Lipoprotein n=1 Tax=Tropicimonas omnivorans TaxID=3075590 RepID=A0ABU3DLB4_9RHOB|nr:hypothetical protein [Roseicyclus sp. F158]MDT0684500.1 hypothetical protein [Roseicyclus sp. F158]